MNLASGSKKVAPRNATRKRRELFVEQLRSIASERLVFLDGSGVTTQMTERYRRARRGRRIAEATPEGDWKVLANLGGMSVSGMIATMTIEAATDAGIFLAYLDHVLYPKLQPGQIVIMDNLSSHKVAGVRERIEGVGASLLYLPPYSPDVNPIEKAWAKLNQQLRAAKQEQPTHSTTPSQNYCPPSDHKTQSHVQTASAPFTP